MNERVRKHARRKYGEDSFEQVEGGREGGREGGGGEGERESRSGEQVGLLCERAARSDRWGWKRRSETRAHTHTHTHTNACQCRFRPCHALKTFKEDARASLRGHVILLGGNQGKTLKKNRHLSDAGWGRGN